MPRVPESPGVTVLPEGAYGMVRYAKPQINDDFLRGGQAATEAMKLSAEAQKQLQKQKAEAQELAATDLANQFFNKGTAMLVGQDGALRTMGANIKDGHRGQPFALGWLNDIDEMGRDLSGGSPYRHSEDESVPTRLCFEACGA